MIGRRAFLGCAAAALARPAWGAALAVPTVDALELTPLIDSTVNVFGEAVTRPDFTLTPAPRTADYHRTYIAEWGYSLLARSHTAGVTRTTLIDFGYTGAALLENMALLGVDPASVDAMVLSHGHYDHFGGLDGLLADGRVRRGTPLYIGGEEAFCARLRGTDPGGPSFGAIDRPALAKAGIALRVSGDPALVAGQGFTTGRIPFVSPERPRVPSAMKPGENCDRAALDPAKRDATLLPDDAVHELGTAFHLRGRGLVVIGSCSHRGIINTVRQAQAVSGIDKVHAIVGGFHLVPPQTRAQMLETIALMQAIAPDYVIPGHCSGDGFIEAAEQAMPGKVFRSIVGFRYAFT